MVELVTMVLSVNQSISQVMNQSINLDRVNLPQGF